MPEQKSNNEMGWKQYESDAKFLRDIVEHLTQREQEGAIPVSSPDEVAAFQKWKKQEERKKIGRASCRERV